MENLEIEVKFYIDNPSAMRQAIRNLGAVSAGRHFEHNLRLESKEGRLKKKGALLRLRQDRKSVLTYKARPPGGEDPQYKVFTEYETEVSDLAATRAILEALGFYPVQIYEKWRETFRLNQTHLCLDEMPYGHFLEIEGEKERIKAIASQLDLRWERRILRNYLAIFDMLKQEKQLPFSHLSFDNFARINIDISQYLHRLEAGTG